MLLLVYFLVYWYDDIGYVDNRLLFVIRRYDDIRSCRYGGIDFYGIRNVDIEFSRYVAIHVFGIRMYFDILCYRYVVIDIFAITWYVDIELCRYVYIIFLG